MKNFIYAIIAIVIIGTAGYFMFRGNAKESTADNNTATTGTNSENNGKIVDGDIIMPGAIATLYYGDGCSHCANTEKWLLENGYLPKSTPVKQADVDSWIGNVKVKFNLKEIWYNKGNSAELSTATKELGLSDDSVGVPFLYDSANKKSYVGETDIKSFFESRK
ncbi:MAG: hypothetical protein WC451_01820 [Patescibacteria group bacterium]